MTAPTTAAAHRESDRPEPVLETASASAKVAAAYQAVLAVIALVSGGVSLDNFGAIVQAVAVAVGAVGAVAVIVVGYVRTMRKAEAVRDAVTPIADPVGTDGKPLVSTDVVEQVAADAHEAALATYQPSDELLAAARAAVASLPA